MDEFSYARDDDLGRIVRREIVRNPGVFRVLSATPEGREGLRRQRAIAHRMVIATDDVEMATFAGWMLHEIARALRQQRRSERKSKGARDGS